VREQIEKGAVADVPTLEEEEMARMQLAGTFIDTFVNVSSLKGVVRICLSFCDVIISVTSPWLSSTWTLRNCLWIFMDSSTMNKEEEGLAAFP